MTPVGVFFTAIFPLVINDQAFCQQPHIMMKLNCAAPPLAAIRRVPFRFATGRWWIEATLWYSMWIIPAAEHIKLCATPRERTKRF